MELGPEELWGQLPAVDLPAIEPLKWTSLDALVDARNEKVISKKVRREAEWRLRAAWLSQLGYAEDASTRAKQLTIVPKEGEPDAEVIRFAILGDTGEGDPSQWAVVRPFLALHRRSPRYEFAFVLSDVIYPAGDSADYPQRFYGPYHAFRRPLYAIPGNHDWDDGSLTGFMTHFARNHAGARVDDAGPAVLAALRTTKRAWRPWRGINPPRSGDRRVAHALAARATRDAKVEEAGGRYPTGQPGSYFRLKVGRLWLVCIDTGMTGTIDEEQAEWLIRASQAPGPKLLLTGKPLVVNGKAHPCTIAWRTSESTVRPSSVEEIVENESHGYMATIGGDVHNYQRYQVGGRVHFVAGGSGAFLASTEFLDDDGHPPEHEPCMLYPSSGLSRVHFEWGVGNRLLGSRLLPGIAAVTGVVLAALFSLARARFGDAPRLGTLLSTFVVLVILGLWHLKSVTRDRWTIAAMALLLLSPLLAAVVPFPERNEDFRGEYYGGYWAAIGLFTLVAVSVTRKLTAPAGMTIRERRPYATLGLGAAVWLGLMLVLSAYGTLTAFDAMDGKQRLFVGLTGVAVLAAGLLTHLAVGHVWRLLFLWVILIGGPGVLLFGLKWNESDREQEAFRYGIFEGIAVLLAAMAVVVALIAFYARVRLLASRPPDELRRRTAEAEGRYAMANSRPRRELMAAILRSIGRADWLGPIFETREPPMLKSFLDVEVSRGAVKITAYRASGFEAEADDPVAIDWVTIPLPSSDDLTNATVASRA